MAKSQAFGGMSDGSIADVHFRQGSVLTKKAGIVSVRDIMDADPQGLSEELKMNMLCTNITKSAPFYDAELDDGGRDSIEFLEKCAEFDRYLGTISPTGFAKRCIGYVSGCGTALSIVRSVSGKGAEPLRYGVSAECAGSAIFHKDGDGESYGNARWKDIIPVEIELKEESVLTGKAGIVKLSEMLYPDFYDGCKDVSEEDKMKVIEAMMKRRGGEGYPKEAIEILGVERMDRIKYLWVLSGAFSPLCYADKVVGFGGADDAEKPWKTVELTNMLFSVKENGNGYQPMNSYRIPLDCVKDIRLFPAGIKDAL
jgi:hypothetical protein